MEEGGGVERMNLINCGKNEFNKLSVQMPFCYPCIQSAGSEGALGSAVYGGANLGNIIPQALCSKSESFPPPSSGNPSLDQADIPLGSSTMSSHQLGAPAGPLPALFMPRGSPGEAG